MQPQTFRRLFYSGIIALGMAVASGCSMFSSADARYEPSQLTEYPAAISAGIAWSVPLGSGSGTGFAPVLAGESIYAATPSGNVLSINASSGRVLWQTSANTRLTAGVGSDGNTTAVAAADGTVIAFDSQGREKWRTKATSEVSIPPVVGDGLVVVRSGDYRVQAFNAANGEPVWNVQRPGPALALKTSMQMIIMEGMVITGLPNGKLMAINAESGAVQWEGTVAVSQGATDLERIIDVVGAPQVTGSLLCGASYQGRIACFDIATGGDLAWAQSFSTTVGMVVDSEHAYAPNARDTIFAFNLQDGQEAWQQKALANRHLVTPAVVAQALVVGDFEGYVHFLARNDGRLLGRLNLGGGAIVSPLLATNYGVAVQSGNGNLVMVKLN